MQPWAQDFTQPQTLYLRGPSSDTHGYYKYNPSHIILESRAFAHSGNTPPLEDQHTENILTSS
jgi:hypothetical protein